MSENDSQVGQFYADFENDGFLLIIFSSLMLVVSFSILLGLSLWFFLSKPSPVHFKTAEGWRIYSPVPVNLPYISEPNLFQWVGDVLPRLFTLDFVNYDAQVKASSGYFTPEGWNKFQQALQKYASHDSVMKGKLFVNAAAASAPFILNQGLLQGSYGWWIQMPLDLSYSSSEPSKVRPMVAQVLVIRVSTRDDLKGVKIDNIILKDGDQSGVNE